MAFDAHKNFAYSTVATAPSPASSGTSLVVHAGDGALFPATPFNATVWPAGAQPTTANAEIVRVTNIATDTFTITRTQESTSARTIGIGDQISATITAKVLTDIEGAVNVAAPTGVAATDTANIQAAHDALPGGGGQINLRAGTYVLNASAPLSFTKSIYLKGQGMEITILTLDSATVTAITSTGSNCVFEDFTLRNNHATTPTAGAGISVTGGGNRNRYRNIMIDSFYNNLDQQYGNGWIAQDCFIRNHANIGIKVQNVAATDSGDGAILGCQISTAILGGTHGIEFVSGGNLRIQGNQIVGSNTSGQSAVGVYLNPGVTTSDLLVIGNSIENIDYGFAFAFSPAGTFATVVIQANQFFVLSGGQSIDLAATATSIYSFITVGGNICRNGQYGLSISNIDHITYGPNVYGGQTTSALNVTGTNTNSLQVGNG